MWVLGAVNAPGAVPIPPSGKLDLASALARAGGLAADADPDRIKLIRATGGRLVHSWASIQGTELSAGDRIVVHERRFLPKVVSILGQVREPGQVALPPGGELDLVTAIALAGGFSEVAKREKVTVSRAGRNLLINMGEGNGQEARQFNLRPGDIVTVAERLF